VPPAIAMTSWVYMRSTGKRRRGLGLLVATGLAVRLGFVRGSPAGAAAGAPGDDFPADFQAI
jgi:hypothetical protein